VNFQILNPFAPAIPNANIKVQPEDALKPPKTWALKKHESARDIKYSTEDALKQGLHMVEILNTGLKKLELGSKLRQEVWDKGALCTVCFIETQRIDASHSHRNSDVRNAFYAVLVVTDAFF